MRQSQSGHGGGVVTARVRAWAEQPSVDATLSLLDSLIADPSARAPHVDAVAQVVDHLPTDVRVLLRLGRLQLQMGKLHEAQQTLSAARQADPHAREPCRYLGEVLLRRGDAHRAVELLERAALAPLRSSRPELLPLDDDAELWSARARKLTHVQDQFGEQGVILELALLLESNQLDARRESVSRDDVTPPGPGHLARVDVHEHPREADVGHDSLSVTLHAAALPDVQEWNRTPSATVPSGSGAISARGAGFIAGARALTVVSGAPSRAQNAALADERTRPWSSRKVLDALERVGLYEPASTVLGAEDWAARAVPAGQRRRNIVVYGALALALLVCIGSLLAWGLRQRVKAITESELAAERADIDVRLASPTALTRAESDLAHAMALNSRSVRSARAWLHDRILRVHWWPSDVRRDGGLASAIERGKMVGLREIDLVEGRLTLSLASNDTPSAVWLARTLDAGSARSRDDAWRELAVGWVLERAGDTRALERYEHALTLDPGLVAARLSLMKLAALAAASEQVERLGRELPPEFRAVRDDLLDLAQLGRPSERTRRTVDATSPDAVLRPAGFGWIASALTLADPTHSVEARRGAAERAILAARDPGDLARIGELALAVSDTTASRASLLALEASPIFPPARVLAARAALRLGRPDDAGRALDDLAPSPLVVALRAWVSYERGEWPVSTKLHASALPEEPALSSIVAPLRWVTMQAAAPGPLSAKHKAELEEFASGPDTGPLVAFDVRLDGGDMAGAAVLARRWGDRGPAHSLRLGRLARLQRRLPEAERQLRLATEGGPMIGIALIERVHVLVSLHRANEALDLLNRFSALVPAHQPWLRVLALTGSGKLKQAKALVDEQRPVDLDRAPWTLRRDIIMALAAVGDPRAVGLVRSALLQRHQDPDLLDVARRLGVNARAVVSAAYVPAGAR